MPIANCYIKSKISKNPDFEDICREWASLIGVDPKDITINVIRDFEQYGQKYVLMIDLFLPSLWSEANVERIQKSLSELMSKHLRIEESEIFIKTLIIKSGHVFSNGKSENW